mgnify:FL=1
MIVVAAVLVDAAPDRPAALATAKSGRAAVDDVAAVDSSAVRAIPAAGLATAPHVALAANATTTTKPTSGLAVTVVAAGAVGIHGRRGCGLRGRRKSGTPATS